MRSAATLAALLLAAAPARADHPSIWLLPGPLVGLGSGGLTLGGGLSLVSFDGDVGSAVGLCGQWESVELQHGRAALAAEAFHRAFGLGLGAALERGPGPAGTVELHVAPVYSLGIASVALRIDWPVGAFGSGPGYGADVGIAVTLKFPVLLYANGHHYVLSPGWM